MSARIDVHADLTFRYTAPGSGAVADGTISADGRTVDVRVTDARLVAGQLSRPFARRVAAAIARQGLVVTLSAPEGTIITVGDVRTSVLHRLLTRSRHIRLGGPRALRSLLAFSRDEGDGQPLMPPPTLLPLLPTVTGPRPRTVTTTHDPRGGGRPRVAFARGEHPWAGDDQRVEYLKRPRTTFGSEDTCDVRVEGLEPLHAVVERRDDDEYVLTHVAPAGSSTVGGERASGHVLRTGARIQLGDSVMTYLRDEYADHGRPYGGRIGGELGRQRPQPRPRARTSDVTGKPRTHRDPGQYY